MHIRHIFPSQLFVNVSARDFTDSLRKHYCLGEAFHDEFLMRNKQGCSFWHFFLNVTFCKCHCYFACPRCPSKEPAVVTLISWSDQTIPEDLVFTKAKFIQEAWEAFLHSALTEGAFHGTFTKIYKARLYDSVYCIWRTQCIYRVQNEKLHKRGNTVWSFSFQNDAAAQTGLSRFHVVI